MASFEQTFATSLLRSLGRPVTPRAVRNIMGWEYAEGGHTHNSARWNPLNTTQDMPGSGDTGSQGNISVFRDLPQGVEATRRTLTNGRYGSILSSLDADPNTFARAVNATPWGTKTNFASRISSAPVSGNLQAAGPAPTRPRARMALPPLTGGADARRNLNLQAIGAINEIGQPGGVRPATLLGLASARSQVDAAQAATTAIRQQRGGDPGIPANAPGAQADDASGAINGLVPILPGKAGGFSTAGGDPEGQGGSHRAVDWFANHGVPVRAPTSGRVVRITPHSGKGSGQVFGGTLSIRGDDGRLYVMRHIDPLGFRVGSQVSPGQHVGTPTDWTGGSDHAHFEVYPPGGSDREYSARALNPASLYGWS